MINETFGPGGFKKFREPGRILTKLVPPKFSLPSKIRAFEFNLFFPTFFLFPTLKTRPRTFVGKNYKFEISTNATSRILLKFVNRLLFTLINKVLFDTCEKTAERNFLSTRRKSLYLLSSL